MVGNIVFRECRQETIGSVPFDDQQPVERRGLVTRYIIDDLGRWEPRIRVLNVRTLVNDTRLEVSIDYEILSLSVEDAVTLVFRRSDRVGVL